MLTIHMLPAAHGDCLWIEYGAPGKVHRVLIDGGTAPTYETLRAKIKALPPAERHFELLVITHVDADHIEGIVKLLGAEGLDATFGDVWFNGLHHLTEGQPADFGGLQGEYLTAILQKRKLPWNAAFGGHAIVVPDDGPLPVHELPGGLRLTLLSPNRGTVAKMAEAWEDEVTAAGLDPASPNKREEVLAMLASKGKRLVAKSFAEDDGPDVEALVAEKYGRDTSPANGSSLAFLAEYKGKSVLLGADAYSEVLIPSVKRLLAARGAKVLQLDAFKLPHHGSRANLSQELLALLHARDVLVSTSGAVFEHPDAEAIARLLKAKWSPTFHFNYRSDETSIWDNQDLKREHGYTTRYPESEKSGLLVPIG
jgi:hypothetical protein